MEGMLMPHRICIPTVLNNVPYCDHERDICHECCQVPWEAKARRRFRLPDSGQPDYPPSLALAFPDAHLRQLIGKRWLDMQKALFLPPRLLRVASITLPAPPPDPPISAPQPRLRHLFHQLQLISAARRYFFATHATILLNDYDTFAHAALLYENVLADVEKCAAHLYAQDQSAWRSKASIVTTIGYFLGLETQRTFWRIMEMTMDAFVRYLESYDEALDHQVVMEDKVKACLLQCIAHVFWSLQQAQYQLDELRRQQHVDFQHKGGFPFYPYRDVQALEAGLDVHVLITKMSTAPVFNFPRYSALLSAFRQASGFSQQMPDVNVEIMAVIDELTTRFRAMELLILAAVMVSTTDEIKDAIGSCKFDRQAEGSTCITEDLNDTGRRAPLPSQNLSLLQGLIIKAVKTRRKHNVTFLQLRLLTSESSQKVAENMFQAFKKKYIHLYHGSIRPEFGRQEGSLLPVHAVRRFQHRKEVAKKKKNQQQTLVMQMDIAEDRAVPTVNVDAEFFWEVGNTSIEKYVPLPVRQKVKTRKQGGDGADSDTSNEGSQQSTPKSVCGDSSEKSQEISRVYRPVKESDLKTRDILWRKAKGVLKWRNMVHFLTQVGCKVVSMDGSIKKVVDTVTGRWALLHRPHPGEDCRPDQRDSYRMHLEDWLHIQYSDVVPAEETPDNQPMAAAI